MTDAKEIFKTEYLQYRVI